MRSVTCLILILLLVLSGCTTLVNERRRAAAREHSDVDNLRADLRRLQERVEGIATAQQDLYRETETLRGFQEENSRGIKDRLAEMERALKAAETARENVRREIIDNLSRKMAEIMRSQAGHFSGVEEGVEHVVKPGETLSEIAAVYNVKVSTIVKANNLKSADSIKVGQKLFIRE